MPGWCSPLVSDRERWRPAINKVAEARLRLGCLARLRWLVVGAGGLPRLCRREHAGPVRRSTRPAHRRRVRAPYSSRQPCACRPSRLPLRTVAALLLGTTHCLRGAMGIRGYSVGLTHQDLRSADCGGGCCGARAMRRVRARLRWMRGRAAGRGRGGGVRAAGRRWLGWLGGVADAPCYAGTTYEIGVGG